MAFYIFHEHEQFFRNADFTDCCACQFSETEEGNRLPIWTLPCEHVFYISAVEIGTKSL